MLDTKVSLTDDGGRYDSLKCWGMGNHCLNLKMNAPIMLLMNLKRTISLCNGTHLMVKKLGERLLEAEIITGTNIGQASCNSRDNNVTRK